MMNRIDWKNDDIKGLLVEEEIKGVVVDEDDEEDDCDGDEGDVEVGTLII